MPSSPRRIDWRYQRQSPRRWSSVFRLRPLGLKLSNPFLSVPLGCGRPLHRVTVHLGRVLGDPLLVVKLAGNDERDLPVLELRVLDLDFPRLALSSPRSDRSGQLVPLQLELEGRLTLLSTPLGFPLPGAGRVVLLVLSDSQSTESEYADRIARANGWQD